MSHCSGTMTSTLSGHNRHIRSCDATGARTEMHSLPEQMFQTFRLGEVIAYKKLVCNPRDGSENYSNVHTRTLSSCVHAGSGHPLPRPPTTFLQMTTTSDRRYCASIAVSSIATTPRITYRQLHRSHASHVAACGECARRTESPCELPSSNISLMSSQLSTGTCRQRIHFV